MLLVIYRVILDRFGFRRLDRQKDLITLWSMLQRDVIFLAKRH